MGGHLALQMLLHSRHRFALAGIIGLSCFLSDSSLLWADLAACADNGTLSALPPETETP